ncbi:hypothetical protein I7I51_00096 [Histoplasma capsulatum]|uniref:Uncharacterized protein n=1 Tax=Ajellomyces capsulatus TaxID=5037 RepID=A0A8A1MAR0_AJECA|nr:hypothetical protein I7I51_00096 [Histoplasma capsulatum]
MVNKLSHASLIGIRYGFSEKADMQRWWPPWHSQLPCPDMMPKLACKNHRRVHGPIILYTTSSIVPRTLSLYSSPKSEGPKPLVPVVDLVPLIASGIEAPWMPKYARHASSVVSKGGRATHQKKPSPVLKGEQGCLCVRQNEPHI